MTKPEEEKLRDQVYNLRKSINELTKEVSEEKTKRVKTLDSFNESVRRENSKLWYVVRVALRDETIKDQIEKDPYSNPFK